VGGPVGAEPVGDDQPGHVLKILEELAEEPLRRGSVPPALDEDVEDAAVLVDGPPQIAHRPVDLDVHLVQMPLVARARPPAAQAPGAGGTERGTPGPDRLIRHHDAAFEEDSSTSRYESGKQ
jgi:hypothetical protein